METNDLRLRFDKIKSDIFNSKKYWIIYLAAILVIFFSLMDFNNYDHPKFEILVFVLMSILGVFFISFYKGHSDEKDFYKTVFIVIFVVGIVFSCLTPIFCTHDEVEHFVRAEMTSDGVIFPQYDEKTSFNLSDIEFTGAYLTIQSTLDLAEKGKNPTYDYMDMVNSSIFNTDADTSPINTTPVLFFSAFAQNPFYGYIAPAIGIAIAKLLDLNAIWMLWLGRIFNSLMYAAIVSYAIKKTPILKMPLFVVACIPAALSQAAGVSIDPLINGLAILSIAYFLMLYKSPKGSLDYKPIIKFSILVLILGTCKVTYFIFIFLILFVPLENFKEKKYYYYGFLSIIITLGVFALWSKFYVDPGVHNSIRYSVPNAHDSYGQFKYMLTHKKDTLVELLHVFTYLPNDLCCESYFSTKFSSLYLLLLGGVFFFYPHEKIHLKTKLGSLLVFLMLYFGTYFMFMVSWNQVGQLVPTGVQPRYFFPAFGLLPIIFGFNHIEGDMSEINQWILVLVMVFIVSRMLTIVTLVY